jgi:hypothetical protein
VSNAGLANAVVRDATALKHGDVKRDRRWSIKGGRGSAAFVSNRRVRRGLARAVREIRLLTVDARAGGHQAEASELMSATAASEGATRDVRELGKRLASTYDRTAEVLEHTAAIAERIAERMRRSGQSVVAEDEAGVANRARQAAQRARFLAAKQRIPLAQVQSDRAAPGNRS